MLVDVFHMTVRNKENDAYLLNTSQEYQWHRRVLCERDGKLGIKLRLTSRMLSCDVIPSGPEAGSA